jgi:membrane protein implicated in regulation of membrane protease activity
MRARRALGYLMLAAIFVGCWLGLAALFVGELWLVLLALLTSAAAFTAAYALFGPYGPAPSRREVERRRRARAEIELPAWVNSAGEAHKRKKHNEN